MPGLAFTLAAALKCECQFLMSRRLERLLSLDTLLRSCKRHTQASLAVALEVSERTVRNDLAFLRDSMKAPIAYDAKRGHHYTDPSWRLPSLSLSRGELFALTLGAKMLQAHAGTPYEAELRSAIEQLSQRAPQQTWVDLQQLAEERLVFNSGAETELDPEVWNQLVEACHQSRRVWLRYYTASRDAESNRTVDPYFVHLYRASNPYLIGFCHQRQDRRWFRIDRVREAQLLDETFERDPNFDPRAHLEQVFQYEVGERPERVAIWFDATTAPFIRERRWHATQQLTEHDDSSLTLTFTSSGLNDVKRWVLGYGSGAVAQEPPALVQLIREEIAAMQRHYENT